MIMAKNWNTGEWKRRSNLLYRLRKKGVSVDTRRRIIYIPYEEDPHQAVQIDCLRKEYHFNVQFILT